MPDRKKRVTQREREEKYSGIGWSSCPTPSAALSIAFPQPCFWGPCELCEMGDERGDVMLGVCDYTSELGYPSFEICLVALISTVAEEK